MALAPLGKPTSVGLLPNSVGMAHTDPNLTLLLAHKGIERRVVAIDEVVGATNASAPSRDHATVARVAMGGGNLIISGKKREELSSVLGVVNEWRTSYVTVKRERKMLVVSSC